MHKFDSLFKSKNIFFIAIVIFVLSSFTLYHNRSDILKLFRSKNKDLSQIPDQAVENKENTTLEEKEAAPLLSTKSLLNYISSLKFPEAPTNLVEPKLETVVNSASFGYKEQGAKKPITNRRATSDEVGVWVSLNYINYSLNVNLLVYNFMQDKDYSKELKIVKSRLLPQDIRNILNNLETYNNYLFSKSSSEEVIFPTNHKWLEKFIKIEKKKPSAMMITEQDKPLILENLNYLIDCLYSEKFMQEFVNQDV